jgi:hypothetical protein
LRSFIVRLNHAHIALRASSAAKAATSLRGADSTPPVARCQGSRSQAESDVAHRETATAIFAAAVSIAVDTFAALDYETKARNVRLVAA